VNKIISQLEEIVGKFGGSSVADIEKIKHVAKIVTGEYDDIVRTGVVLSAPGKRYSGDIKITDTLIELLDLSKSGQDYQHPLDTVVSRFTEITEGLCLGEKRLENGKTISYSDYIRNEMTWRLDQKDNLSEEKFEALVKSVGEFLMSHIFVDYLNGIGKDSFLVLPEESGFYVEGNPANVRTSEDSVQNLAKFIEGKEGIAIMPGYYGTFKDGDVQALKSWDGSKRFAVGTYRRGGSDISGVNLAAAISEVRKKDANYSKLLIHDNYTDKPGVAVINPSLKGEGAIDYVKTMSPEDAMQLTDAGFCVLVPQAMEIVMKYDIPTRVRSTFKFDAEGQPVIDFDSQDRGTLIVSGCDYGLNRNSDIVGAAYKGDLTSISYTGQDAKGMMEKLKQLLESHSVEVGQTDLVNSSSLLCNFKFEEGVITPEDRVYILATAKQQLRSEYQIVDLEERNGISLLTLVGPGVNKPELLPQIFGSIGPQRRGKDKEGIPVLYLSNPPGSNCLVLGFQEEPGNPVYRAERATRRVNQVLFNGHS